MTILHGWINGIDDVNEAKKKLIITFKISNSIQYVWYEWR